MLVPYDLRDTDGAARESSLDFALRLLKDRGVAVAPGETFGRASARHIRVSLAQDEHIVRHDPLFCREGVGGKEVWLAIKPAADIHADAEKITLHMALLMSLN